MQIPIPLFGVGYFPNSTEHVSLILGHLAQDLESLRGCSATPANASLGSLGVDGSSIGSHKL